MKQVFIETDKIKRLIERFHQVSDEENADLPTVFAALSIMLDAAKEYGFSHIEKIPTEAQ